MSLFPPYYGELDIDKEKHNPLKNYADGILQKFPDVLMTEPPTGWYKTIPRIDSGWGCGYRNIQTILSSLLEISEFSNLLPRFVPSIPSIQLLIEAAWQNGFDRFFFTFLPCHLFIQYFFF